MSVVVVGLSQRTVPIDLLGRMSVAPADLPKALHGLVTRTHLMEAVVLSTCVRTEVYALVDRFHDGTGEVRDFLAELSGSAPESFSDHLYTYFDDGAAAHLFGVAAGIDSPVVGEGEVLGQVRQAWEAAQREGTAGPALSGLFRHAVEVGKRARSDTSISRGTTSVSQAAVAMAARALDGLDGRRAVLVGAGEMGEGMAAALADRGVERIVVANRTRARSSALVSSLGERGVSAEAVTMADLAEAVAAADVVLTSTGAPGLVLDADTVASSMDRRPDRPLLLVDIAVPRDVDLAVRSVPNVTLLDMDDLRAFAEAGLAGRLSEVGKVRAIVAEEVERYWGRTRERTAAPVVAALRDRAEEIRAAELDRFRGRLGDLDERQAQAVEALTRRLVAKLLHEPTVNLKRAAGGPVGERLSEALRALFDL